MQSLLQGVWRCSLMQEVPSPQGALLASPDSRKRRGTLMHPNRPSVDARTCRRSLPFVGLVCLFSWGCESASAVAPGDPQSLANPLSTGRYFVYDGQQYPTVASWNPSNLSPGFSIHFWEVPASGSGCSIEQSDGPTIQGFGWADSQTDTGIASGPEQLSPWCPASNWQGLSYVRVKNDPSGGGIGVYTHTGPKPWDGSNSFWAPYRGSTVADHVCPIVRDIDPSSGSRCHPTRTGNRPRRTCRRLQRRPSSNR